MKLKQKKKKAPAALGKRREAPGAPVDVELPQADDGRVKNEYYIKVSQGYRLARMVTLAVFVLFLLVMITSFSEEITIDNMMYLLRDINVTSDNAAAFSNVSYTAEPIQRFAVYRDELLYVTGGEARLFSATGGTGLTVPMSFESPVAMTSEKYLLIYNLGGSSFSVCNSFSELYRGETMYPILSCDIAANGDFVVVSGGRERRSTVLLYNSDFELKAKYSKGDYVSSAAISDDGKRLVMTSFGVEESEYFFDVSFYAVGADAPTATDRITGEYPLAVRRMGDSFAVITTAAVRIYGADGAKGGSYVHGGIGRFDVSDKYVLFTAERNATGTENSVVILDGSADVCYNAVIEEKLVDAAVTDEGSAFLLSQSHAVLIDVEGGTERTHMIGVGAKRLIPTGKESALLCLSSSAYTIDFRVASRPDETTG